MIFNIIIIVLSIILENIFNLYLTNLKYLSPLFTLISLLFVFPYFKNSKRDFLIFSFLTGLIYDLFFTNFYVLNSFIFLIVSFGTFYILKNHNYNLITILYSSFFSIFLYNLLLFLIFNFFKYTNYSLMDLSFILRHFLIGNILYIIIIYIILNNKHFKHIIKI